MESAKAGKPVGHHDQDADSSLNGCLGVRETRERPSFRRLMRCYAWLRFKMSILYTVGHSSHSFEEFAELLSRQKIDVVVDTRSAPYSRYAPQFDREILQRTLSKSGLKYLFLGGDLGVAHKWEYDSQGHVVYGRIKSDPSFSSGIERLERGITEFRVALMCGKRIRLIATGVCLIGRTMVERGHQIMHIRADGRIQTDAEVTTESGKPLASEQPALFAELDEDQWRSYSIGFTKEKTPASSSTR